MEESTSEEVPDAIFPIPNYIQSETDISFSDIQPSPRSPFVYSEPALTTESVPESTLYEVKNTEDEAPLLAPNFDSDSVSYNVEKKTSIREERCTSEYEINAQHYKIQKQYKAFKRRRRLTDIDFEGILNLIGGCNIWQIAIYLMIAAQQVPHAMFNLSVVYMMYQPDHWCKIKYFSREHVERNEKIGPNWEWEGALNSGIAFPSVPNQQRGGKKWHDQCYYYDRGSERFKEYLSMDMAAAIKLAQNESSDLKRCEQWDYDRSIMRDTVVTQWHRVCDDNWSRAHVHLSYSLGYIAGCLLGGFVSDRYGRKTAIYSFGILSSIFGFLLAFTKEFEVFLAVRFLGAVCNEAADLAAYVLCMEITGVKYRSIIGSLLQAPWACGYAFLALVAYISKSWLTIQIIISSLHTAAMALLYFLPESPRWLIVMNRVKEAETIIRKACHHNKTSLPSDLGLVRHAEKQKWLKSNERAHFYHLFIAKDLRIRSIFVFLIWIATALVYYGMIIALSDQSSPGRSMFVGNFFLNNAIAGAIELPTLMGCVYLLRFGRKRSQMITLIGGGSLIGIAIIVSTKQHTTLALVFMLAGKVCIQGAFNILYIFTSEMYPTIIRNSAVGICSMVSRMGSAASGYIAILSDVTLPIVPMLIFSVFSLFAGFLVLFLPETQGLPLPETIWDAVTMLRTDIKYKCVSFTDSEAEQTKEKKIYGEHEEETN